MLLAAAASAAVTAAREAAGKADQARLDAVTAYREWVSALVPVRKAETLKLRAEWELAAADRAIASAASPEAKQQAEDAKAKVAAQISELETQLAVGKAALQPKHRRDDSCPCGSHGGGAGAHRRGRSGTLRLRATSSRYPCLLAAKPSAFMSARPYSPYSRYPSPLRMPTVRSALIFLPRWNARAPTFNGASFRSSAERTEGRRHDANGSVRKGRNRDVMTNGSEGAKAALDRIIIPQDALDFISERVSSRSSLIISDEALSSETGKETEFVVVLSGEPQGGLKRRRSATRIEAGYGQYWSRF